MFSSAWFWLLLVAILFFIIGIILLALVGTGWGVMLIVLGVLFLIVAGLAGFFSSSRDTAVALLNTEAGAQLVNTAITRQYTEMVPVTRQVTENVPVVQQVTENVPVTRNITRNVPVTRNVTTQVPVTRQVTETIRPGVSTQGAVVVTQQPPVIAQRPAVIAQPPLTAGRQTFPTPVGQALTGPTTGGDRALANLAAAASAPAGPRNGFIGGF